MATKYPITIEGNLTAEPLYGESDNGTKYAKFTVAVRERKLENDKWVDGDIQYHRTTVFGRTAQNVRDSLSKGDGVIVNGNLEFRHWTDQATSESRTSTEIVADHVGPSLRYATATINRSNPKANGPEATATWPSAQPTSAAPAGVA
jgi:single-strand DNA-binding protein